MSRPKHARHAKPAYKARHAKPSQAPARVAAATAVGGLLIPATATSAYAEERSAATVRVSGPAGTVQPGSAPVSMRLIADGRYLNGEPVEIQIPEGSGWRTITKASTTSEGLARASVSVTRDTRIRAHYRGSTTAAPATSSSVVIDVETPFGQRALTEARRHNGKPYRYGATGPSAFDCSGFTRYVFAQLGKSLPHNADAQRDMVQPVARANARPGDLVFMDNNGHVGIYAGNGMMWDSPRAGKNVSLRRIYSSTYAVGRIA